MSALLPAILPCQGCHMKVSVLIHNLNRASVLEKCLHSVAGQTYRPLEVVLLDAGSTDGSMALIEQAAREMQSKGIEVQVVPCEPMGVPASRNFAARKATGDLLCGIDNDATFVDSECIKKAVKHFNAGGNGHLALVSFRVLSGDTDEIDPFSWVFRRPIEDWSKRSFDTFTFAGTGFCVRKDAYWAVEGFWEHLKYSREEEEMALGLIDRGWGLMYTPDIAIRHYFDPRGRMSVTDRRFTELRNGILIFYRRFPLPVALLTILGRILTMSAKMVLRQKQSPAKLIPAVGEAVGEWKQNKLERKPVSYTSVLRYGSLHLQKP